MRTTLFVSALIVGCAVSQSCYAAATVEEVVGPVSVNHAGTGYRSIKSDKRVDTGDAVIAGHKGQAVIVYDDGCRVRVESTQRVVVKDKPPCVAGLDESPVVFGVGAAIAAGGAAVLVSDTEGKPASP